MAQRLIVQGNGRFALFSTIVDNITIYDATVEELVADACQKASAEAEQRVREWCEGPCPGRGHFTSEQAVEWVRAAHGDVEAEKTRMLLAGESDPEDAEPLGTKHKIIIEVELTDDDLAAASHVMFGPWDGAPKLGGAAVKEHFLEGAVQRQLHLMRSAKKWKDCNGYEALPKSEEGHTMTEVEDDEGRVHHVMLPNGTMWRPQVLRPAEGSWECEGSPTKTCWYDDQRDPAWDFCLFCGNPDERE